MDAVRAESYPVVPFPATQAGVRTVDAALGLADQLPVSRGELRKRRVVLVIKYKLLFHTPSFLG